VTAAKRHAPGLITALRQPGSHAQEAEETGAHSGRWMRRGTKLILFGV
jgi:hypothetical protein